ncbi:protein PBDC1-like [Thomomys bottae]
MEAVSELNELVSGELMSVAHALSLPAESCDNDPVIEMAWAMRTMQHAEVYYKLISSVDPQFLKLTKVDDQIYSESWKSFEKLRIDVLDPEELKSETAKENWRPFCLKFDGLVEDFIHVTLLQLDSCKGYTEESTIFAPRIQFLAIEIAQNREGYNTAVYKAQNKGEKGAGNRDKGEKEVGSGGSGEKEAGSKGKENEADSGEKVENGAIDSEDEKEKNNNGEDKQPVKEISEISTWKAAFQSM